MGGPLIEDGRPAKRIKLDAPSQDRHRPNPVHHQICLDSHPHASSSLHSGDPTASWPPSLPLQTQPQQQQQHQPPPQQQHQQHPSLLRGHLPEVVAPAISTTEPSPSSRSLPGYHHQGQVLQAQLPRRDLHPPPHQEHAAALPTTITMVPVSPGEDLQALWSTGPDAALDGSWKWPSSSPAPMASQMLVAVQPSNALPFNSLDVFPAPSLSASTIHSEYQTPLSSAITDVEVDGPSATTRLPFTRPSPHAYKRPRYAVSSSNETVSSSSYKPPKFHSRRPTSRDSLISPFKDCLGRFGEANRRRFDRPFDGKVNGYIKFNWPKDKQSRRSSSVQAISDVPDVAEATGSGAEVESPRTSLTPVGPLPVSGPTANAAIVFVQDLDYHGFDFSGFLQHSPSPTEGFSPILSQSTAEFSTDVAPMGAPRMVPKLFGYEAKMDQTDRKFWTFYIKNWCPGRSVLQETNLWLKDFAQMHKSDGVRAAIQSLAGIYIYDYLPRDDVRKRVNERFFEAESRLSSLLADPATTTNEGRANELITIAVILSMQDIVLTERRLARPSMPRWLSGFQQGELFLQATDQGSRFWKRSNAQLSSLRISQSIIVGRAVILAQPMTELPAPATFDPEAEASRFGWLLYGSESDMYQIHGGCGFSKKLLHIMSQITYCAARLQQDPENIVVPMTTQYLLKELVQMRQWSSESKDWKSAKAGPSVADWLRGMPAGYQIDTSAEMTDVTAEAWRLTAIIYLQCRVLRLPRSHPEVLATMSDLAACIKVMPTSGFQFTAQAPLFPVFLLGLLATRPSHRAASKTWFDEVVSTPVRSSVPPLYEALQRIWQWIDNVIAITTSTSVEAEPIGHRFAWWEQLVAEVTDRENEVLCLT
ncbi:hypothetical protein JDV02_008536 [Purpureocillium takamizusanense]|uniref:Transcription factor domain-containing protein n=1 Tax=Purpureocillium takamizusanense TaxID=2060973 RepID=A0A9Q8VDE6_9HYPO|nr:uncharacterized protein JDV02_008536 [Purpureocillium takamizusanense]UNI22670.1 hypothetical protein JDV02_008536 [Purpureocillium takamizusanense]